MAMIGKEGLACLVSQFSAFSVLKGGFPSEILNSQFSILNS